MVLFDRKSNVNFHNNCLIVPFSPNSHGPNKMKGSSDEEFYSWLFCCDIENLNSHTPIDEGTVLDNLSNCTGLPDKTHVYCDEDTRKKLLVCLCECSELELLSCEDIVLALTNYWNEFHEAYPILHRPTFDSRKAPPLLLLSMIMTGLEIESRKEQEVKRSSFLRALSIKIARPLRWLIISDKHAQAPALLYIIQALLILLVYEMYHSTREFHERAHIYHAITYNLIQRTPFNLTGLIYQDERSKNGNIWFRCEKSEEDPIILNDWYSWIYFESLKRTYFFAFYLDSTFSLFGHQHLFQADRMIIDLPCSSQKWNASDACLSLKLKNVPISYLSSLKSAIQGENVRINYDEFNLKLILAGIISSSNQLHNYISRASFLSSQLKISDDWKNKITLAIDKWRFDLCEGYTQKSLHQQHFEAIFYCASHLTLSINIFDLLSYCGAPWCVLISDYSNGFKNAVQNISAWVKTIAARRSVIHALSFLCETFSEPIDAHAKNVKQANFSPSIFCSMRVTTMFISTLVLWSYAFALHGPETEGNHSNHVSLENGIQYLYRLRQELFHLSNITLNSEFLNNCGKHNNTSMEKLSNCLPMLQNIHHLRGLCLIVFNSLKDYPWEMAKENANLIYHLYMRSAGSKVIFSKEMYNIERS